jgi:quinol monooxygenase YgiN
MILVTGSFIAREGRLPDALALSLEHVRRSRQEIGCLSHAVHQDAENVSRLVFIEEWSDQEALSAHFAVPASREFVRAVRALAVDAPTISIFTVTRAGD